MSELKRWVIILGVAALVAGPAILGNMWLMSQQIRLLSETQEHKVDCDVEMRKDIAVIGNTVDRLEKMMLHRAAEEKAR